MTSDTHFDAPWSTRLKAMSWGTTILLLVLPLGPLCVPRAPWWSALLPCCATVSLLAGTVGVWLFYIQHQFEDTYWEHEEKWDFVAAGLKGSSYYRLPRVLQWATGNIGLHHIHHLSSRIPNYRLQECLNENPDLRRVTAFTLWESFRCVRLALWDEARGRLVSFREARRA